MKQTNLLEDPVGGLFRKYLIPSISGTMVTSIYILVDTMMIGRGIGADGIAALNLILPLFSFFFGTGMLFGVGGAVLMSVAVGRGNKEEGREYFTASALCALIFAVIYGVGGNLVFTPLTRLLGSNDQLQTLVEQYGRIIVSGAPAYMVSSILQAFVRNDKSPKLVMTAVVSGGICNVIMDYILIFPMGLGMAGAALATVCGSVLTAAILCTHLFSKDNSLKLVKNVKWLLRIRQIVVNGVSSFLMEVAAGIIVFLFNRQLLVYVGNMGVVAYGIISNSALVVNSITNGICQATQPILAVNYGASQMDRVHKIRRLGTAAVLASGVFFCAVGLLFPRVLMAAFVEPTPGLDVLAIPAIRTYFTAFLFTGFNVLSITYFQSVMRPQYALTLSLLRGLFINSALVFVLPLFLGVFGIWLTMPVTEGVVLLFGLWLFAAANRRSRQ